MKLSAQVILWSKLAYWWQTSEVEPPNHISNASGQRQTHLKARDFQTGVKGHPGGVYIITVAAAVAVDE